MWESPHTVDCTPSRAGMYLASNRRSPAESREDYPIALSSKELRTQAAPHEAQPPVSVGRRACS
jgi:hypothetical protein